MAKKPTTKIILGLVGEIASGKDTVAAYLAKKYRSQTISFSQPLRDILDRLYLLQTRENMANLGISLRNKFGQDILARVIAEEVKASSKHIVCLPNVRLVSDMIYIKKLKHFILVRIDAEPKTRYERIIKRSQNADDKKKTWQQFQQDAKLPTEIHIKQIAKGAKFSLDNNDGYKHLYTQIDQMMSKIKNTYV